MEQHTRTVNQHSVGRQQLDNTNQMKHDYTVSFKRAIRWKLMQILADPEWDGIYIDMKSVRDEARDFVLGRHKRFRTLPQFKGPPRDRYGSAPNLRQTRCL